MWVWFWHDLWYGDSCFKDFIPDKKASVASCLSDGQNWNPQFSWSFHDWEVEYVDFFFDLLYSTHLDKLKIKYFGDL
jgi:hypothetical protein